MTLHRYKTSLVARVACGEPAARRAFARAIGVAMTAAMSTIVVACRGDLLGVAPPANVTDGALLGDSIGAEALQAGATGLLAQSTLGDFGAIRFASEMADEMFDGGAGPQQVAPDARAVSPTGSTFFDAVYTDLQQSRLQAAQAIAILEQHRTAVADSEIGQMFALVGYARVLLGETVCSGIPFGTVSRTGALTFGDPVPTDSVFALAVADFDSALAHAGATTTVFTLASVGKGRALLNRARYAEAGAAVSSVPATFLYGLQLVSQQVSLYQVMAQGGFFTTVADRKGGNGLDYVSAHDARVPTMTLGTTQVGTPWIYPLKFSFNPTANDPVSLADGIEAGLIAAEAALSAHDVAGWLAGLNALRANFVAERGPYPADTSYHQLSPLVDPGTDSARVDLMFRERAFWLYGTVHRLGDLRRLIRQYGRNAESVFPTGAYLNGTASAGFPTYGTNVNFPIGSVEQGNPKFHGCLSLGA